MIICWLCEKETNIKETDYGDHRCPFCNVMISVYLPQNKPLEGNNQATTEDEWLNEEKGESKMGKLSEIAKQRSPFLRLAIGESSEPLVYKSWKEITGQFGDSFRYTFEQETPSGLMQKSFDCPQQRFAEQMDTFPFDSKVIIHRRQKIDGNGNPILDKSVYEAEMVK